MAVAIDPETPSTLYAATDRGGVYKSTDGGAGWRLMHPFPPDLGGRIRQIQIDPLTPEILYLATSGGLYKSTNGAHSWMPMNEGLADTNLFGLAIDPSNPSTLYAGTGFRGLFKSTDGASNWVRVFDTTTRIDAVAVAPSNSSVIYIGLGVNQIHKSTDAGANWDLFNTGLDNAFVFNQITVHPTNPDIVYAASDNGLFKTTNGGTSWAVLNTPESVVESVVLDPSNPATVYATSDGVMKSTNRGDSWIEEDEAFSGAQLNTIAVDPVDPLTLYAGANVFEALFKSTDGGGSWAVSNSGFSNLQNTSISFHRQDPSIMYTAASFGGVNKSTAGGQTWKGKRGFNLNGFSEILDVVVDPVNPMNVYAGTRFGFGAAWSDHGGDTWNASNTAVASAVELGIHPTNPSTLYLASTNANVFRSTNAGRDWAGAVSGLPDGVLYTALTVDPSNGNTVYAGSTPAFGGNAGVYKSTDSGSTWVEVSNDLELAAVVALEIAPGNPSVLYAGGPGGKIQKSTNGAESWMILDTGILSLVTALAIDPFNSSGVYAGTQAAGVFKTVDGGASWTEHNSGLPHITVQTLEINPDSGAVHVALDYFSVFRYQSQSVSPQWLFAAGDPAGIGGLFDGVELSNNSGEDASVGLEAIGDSTSGKAGLSDHGALHPLGANQVVDLNLPAGEQFADLRENIFPAILKTLPVWIELTSDNSEIASFFQFGSGTLTQLDGGVAIENLVAKFFFQRVFDGPAAFRGQAATTRLTVLNPGDEPVTVDLSYLPPEDGPLGLPRQATRKIPARSFLDKTASDLFGTSISGGYVAGEVTEGGGVAAFEVVQLSDRPMVLGLNASTGNSSTRSFSAQLASRQDVFTNVNVINTSAASRDVEMTAVRTDGGIEGDPVKVTLAAGAQFSADASQIFGFGVASAADAGLQGGGFVGSLEVAADGDGMVGDVIFGDTVEVGFAASLPLQSEPFTEAIFSQFADIPQPLFHGAGFLLSRQYRIVSSGRSSRYGDHD